MKFFVVCAFLLVLAVGSLAAPSGDGRPGCRTEQEITDKVYRNFWDPTAFWVCSELNKAASLVRCPDQEAFQFSVRECVSWDDWSWEPLVAPLSKPLPESTPAPQQTESQQPEQEHPDQQQPEQQLPGQQRPEE